DDSRAAEDKSREKANLVGSQNEREQAHEQLTGTYTPASWERHRRTMRTEERNLYTDPIPAHTRNIGEKVSDQSSCNLSFRRGLRICDSAWHTLDQVAVTLTIKVTTAAITQIMFATDGINCIDWRRIVSGITITRSTVSAIDWETQLRCYLLVGRRDLLCLE